MNLYLEYMEKKEQFSLNLLRLSTLVIGGLVIFSDVSWAIPLESETEESHKTSTSTTTEAPSEAEYGQRVAIIIAAVISAIVLAIIMVLVIRACCLRRKTQPRKTARGDQNRRKPESLILPSHISNTSAMPPIAEENHLVSGVRAAPTRFGPNRKWYDSTLIPYIDEHGVSMDNLNLR